MAKRKIEDELESLAGLRGAPASEALPDLRKALTGRANLVVAKAAEICARFPAPDVTPDLVRAFDRLLEDAARRDPQCWGKNAIACALRDLGHTDPAVFLRGAGHVQMESVWAGRADTAGPLRGLCLLALPGCPDLRREVILRILVDALADPVATVRGDSARALAAMGGDDSALVLRLKARLGDDDSAVLGQVFESLLALERSGALDFVRQFLSAGNAVAEEAVLALGNSRLDAAPAVLMEAWEAAKAPDFREALLRALSLSRHDDAIAFLRRLVAEGSSRDAAAAQSALALFGARA
jgi:hypothetical protein